MNIQEFLRAFWAGFEAAVVNAGLWISQGFWMGFGLGFGLWTVARVVSLLS